MKKFSKVVLIAAAVCFGLGLTITAGAAMAGGVRTVRQRVDSLMQEKGGRYAASGPVIRPDDDRYDDDDWDDILEDMWDDDHHDEDHFDSHHSSVGLPQFQPDTQQKNQISDNGGGTYDVTGQLEIELEMGRLEIAEGDAADTIQVQVYTDELRVWNETEGNERKLTVRPAQSGVVKLSDDARVVVTLPRGYEFAKVSLDAQAGSIQADRISARLLELDAEAGSIQVADGAVGQLEADCSAGKLEYTGEVSGGLKAECEAGSMAFHVGGKKEDFSYNLETEAGSIQIQDETFTRMRERALTYNGSSKTAVLECELGSIVMDFTGR